MEYLAKTVLCGCTELGVEIISDLAECGFPIHYIVTISEEKAISQKVSGYYNLQHVAKKYNIPCYVAEKYSLKSERDINFFREQNFDLLIQGGWQRLFPDEVLTSLQIGAIGVHGSSDFLPKGRGRSPINWSIIEGRKRFIFHYFLMKPGADDGDIFHFEIADINEWDDCNTLYYKNALITSRVLQEWIPRLKAGDFRLFEQSGDPTYYPKRSEEDGRIDWNKSVFEIFNFIRAITKPYPGAFGYINNSPIKIWKAQPFDTRISFFGKKPGEIIKVFNTGHFVVNCYSGLLLVTEFEYQGRPVVKDIIK